MTKYLNALLSLFLCTISYATDLNQEAKKGILDARSYPFENGHAIKLNGEWAHYPDALLTPAACEYPKNFVTFPDLWKDGRGVATYKVTILLPANDNGYALELPQMYSAYTLWANGKVAARNGEVGTNRASNKPQWLPQLIRVQPIGDSLSLVLQVANFNHSYGGLKNPLLLGLSSQLTTQRSLAETVNIALLCILLLSGFSFLGIYYFVKKEKSVLYFSLMCLVWAVRSVFSELYLAIQWMPNLDWELTVKIEYLTIFLEAAFAMLFMSKLYPLDTNRLIRNILVYPNYLFIFFTMATPAVVYTQFLNIYLFVAGLVIIYAIFIIMRAILYERYGARFAVLGIISGICAFGYNMLSYLGVFEFNPLLYYSCYVVTFTAVAIALTYQLSSNAIKMNAPEKLMFDDFINPSINKGGS